MIIIKEILEENKKQKEELKMALDFFEMMKQEQKSVSKQETSKEEQQPQKEEKVAEVKPKTLKTDKKASAKDAKQEKVNDKPKTAVEEYEYPFSLYTEGHTVDISEYGFEDGKKYTPKQINDIMLKHRHYEFDGEMTYKMFKDDNMLAATAKQYKKG